MVTSKHPYSCRTCWQTWNFFEKVTLSIFPRTSSYSMVGVLRWVSNESVMVLNNHNGSFEARFLQSANPLVSIQVGWIEVSRSSFPFPIQNWYRCSFRSGWRLPILLYGNQVGPCLEEVHGCQSQFPYLQDERLEESELLDWLYQRLARIQRRLHSPLLLDPCFQASFYWTVASNVFCMEGVDKGNIILLTVIVINCRFR